MAAFTVKDNVGAKGARAAALTRRIAELEPGATAEPARLDSLGLGLVDAVLAADDAALGAALDALREARSRGLAGDGAREQLMGWLTAAISFAYWGLERIDSETAAAEVAPGTHAWEFVQALAQSETLGSGELRELLGVDETEVSRSGRRLLESGLVRRTKVGRQVSWELTPRGRALVKRTPKPGPASGDGGPRKPIAGADFWMAAIRQGFEGVAGDEPGMGLRTVDPARERIIESTLELHQTQGVLETSYDDIAASTGMPKKIITDYFPTMEELIKGCGRHALASLRLPPPDRVGEIFAGTSTDEERTHRLIATLFDVYEREGDTIDRARKDRATVPLIAEASEQVEAALEALVAEALRPLDPNAETIASVRALTDIEVWRALRDAGASAEASVDEASTALERWLESHSARV